MAEADWAAIWNGVASLNSTNQLAQRQSRGERHRWFVSGDLDAAFALFFSGFPDLLLIAGLAPVCGLPVDLVIKRILPAVAISIFAGNLFYAWQAYSLARTSGRADVTAVPFGVNTPTIFAYIFLIMLPVYERTHDTSLTWKVGVFACFLSGLIQTVGAFTTDWLRRHTPRAALLCPMAGLAMAFLALGFVLPIFAAPALGILPAIVLLALYASRMRLPGRIPAGLVCLIIGAGLGFVLRELHLLPNVVMLSRPGIYLPRPVAIFTFLHEGYGWEFFSVIFPLSLLDTIVSLQILESVAIAGDDYATRPSLLMNGAATLLAATLGSPFPTSLYFGHMAYKGFGARSGYSILSGSAVAVICMTGLVGPILHFVPLEVVAMMVIWFGLLTVGQAFTEIPRSHAIAVAFGLIPPLAQWALQAITLTATEAGTNLSAIAPKFGDQFAIYGLIALSQGALLISMIWAAAIASMVERKFLTASAWILAGSLLSAIGLIHAYRLTPGGIANELGWFAAPQFTLAYAAAAAFLVCCHWYSKREPSHDRFQPL
jgi:adenine/guanine/hypoxanthine permease